MFLVVAFVLAADEPRQLKYAFKPGDEVKYINTQTRTTSYKKSSKKVEVSLEQKSANLWKVHGVAADGTADVGQTITRLRITQKGGPLGVQTIDSSDEDAPAPLRFLFEDLAVSEIRFKMKSHGEVTDVTLPTKLKERLKAKKEGEAQILNEDGVVRMVKNSVFLLPKKPIAAGGGWDMEPFAYQESGHWITVKNRVTFEGPVEKDGRKLLKFVRIPEYTLKKGEASDGFAEAQIKNQTGEAVIFLAPDSCRLVESESAETIVTETGAGASRVEVQTTINSTIRLKQQEKAEKTTP